MNIQKHNTILDKLLHDRKKKDWISLGLFSLKENGS